MSTRCQNPDCQAPFTLHSSPGLRFRSVDNPSLCEMCGDLVHAFRPNIDKPSEWFMIDPDHLYDGSIVDGDQCGRCGLSAYTLRQRSARLWVAVCEGQEWDGEVIDGCKTEHPVRQKKAMDTIH